MGEKRILNNRQPSVKPLDDIKTSKLLLELTEDFVLYFLLNGVKYRLIIFKGFIFDGSSIPRAAWSILGKAQVGYSLIGSIIHDLMYMVENGLLETCCAYKIDAKFSHNYVGATLQVSRKEADDIMFDTIESNFGAKNNISSTQKVVMYRAIRIFGRKVWRSHSELSEMNPIKC